MKLDKKAIEEIEGKVTEYVLSVYEECRVKHTNTYKAGKNRAFVWLECMVKGAVGDWSNAYFMGIATTDGYIDLYECAFETTTTFEIEEG